MGAGFFCRGLSGLGGKGLGGRGGGLCVTLFAVCFVVDGLWGECVGRLVVM